MSQIFKVSQSKAEIKTHTVDFTNQCPTGGSIVAGTATHIPPGNGTATTPAVQVGTAAPYVFVTVGTLFPVGIHYVDVAATFSDDDVASARLVVDVYDVETSARYGMGDLITELRARTNAGAGDYTIANVVFWNDLQLQSILDRHYMLILGEPLTTQAQVGAGNTLSWHDYQSGYRYFESMGGTPPAFWLSDGTGGTVGTSAYTPDYFNGRFYFGTDTGGSSYFLNGRAFDLNAAAAEVWTQKASHYAEAYDFSTDGHSLSRSQLIKNCRDMANYYRGQAGVTNVTMERADTAVPGDGE